MRISRYEGLVLGWVRIMNIGIIGCGRAARVLHLPALSRIPAAKVMMACDVNADNLDRVRSSVPDLITTSSYADVINHRDIDVVAVMTPAHLHTQIGIEALGAGKHLLVEKPLALSLRDCELLMQAASQSTSVVQVGFNLRFHRLIAEAKELIREGAIGNVEAVRSLVTGSLRQKADMPAWRRERGLGGSPIFEIGTHQFDLWKWITGEPITKISARARVVDGIERTAVVNAETEGGLMLSALFSDWTADSNEIEILGDEGMIRVSIYRIDGLRHYNIHAVAGGISTRLMEMKQAFRGLSDFPRILSMGGDFRASYYFEWLGFFNAIEGQDRASPDLSDGKYATQVALTATHSVTINSPVALSEAPSELPRDQN